MQVKILFFCLLGLGFLPYTITAQHNIYQTWIKTTGSPKLKKGYIHSITDSTINLAPWPSLPAPLSEYPAEKIQWVKVRKQGSIGRGALIGMGIGLVAGFGLGVITSNATSCDEKNLICIRLTPIQSTMIYSLPLVPAGALLGGIIGSRKPTLNIRGSRIELRKQREAIQRYRLRQ